MAKRATSRSRKVDPVRKLAIEAARAADDNNAHEIVLLDLRGISPVTDYFVICTGTSDRQMRTVAQEIMDCGESIDQKVWQVAGMESADWIVLDFVDVVVHVFSEKLRHYYDLELIWGEAPRVRWQRRRSARKAPPAGRGGSDAPE